MCEKKRKNLYLSDHWQTQCPLVFKMQTKRLKPKDKLHWGKKEIIMEVKMLKKEKKLSVCKSLYNLH